MKQAALGVDIGGTKIALGLVDRHGNLLWEKRASSQAEEGGGALLRRVTGLVVEALASTHGNHEVVGVGVATPGQIDYDRGAIRHATDNLPNWGGVPLVDHLAKATGLPVHLDNDGNLAALGEARYGSGRGHSDLICVTVGTGIGGGIVSNGRLIQGTSGSAGGLGHVSCQALDGPLCYCGNRGCVELYSSGRAIASKARTRIEQGETSRLNPDEILGAREVIAAARDGDRLAREVLEEAGRNLGLALLQVVNLFNPSCLVVSGGVAEAGELLLARVRDIVHSMALPSAREAVEVKLGELGGAAGVVGAAAMVWDQVVSESGLGAGGRAATGTGPVECLTAETAPGECSGAGTAQSESTEAGAAKGEGTGAGAVKGERTGAGTVPAEARSAGTTAAVNEEAGDETDASHNTENHSLGAKK